jgi:hypothetical protein
MLMQLLSSGVIDTNTALAMSEQLASGNNNGNGNGNGNSTADVQQSAAGLLAGLNSGTNGSMQYGQHLPTNVLASSPQQMGQGNQHMNNMMNNMNQNNLGVMNPNVNLGQNREGTHSAAITSFNLSPIGSSSADSLSGSSVEMTSQPTSQPYQSVESVIQNLHSQHMQNQHMQNIQNNNTGGSCSPASSAVSSNAGSSGVESSRSFANRLGSFFGMMEGTHNRECVEPVRLSVIGESCEEGWSGNNPDNTANDTVNKSDVGSSDSAIESSIENSMDEGLDSTVNTVNTVKTSITRNAGCSGNSGTAETSITDIADNTVANADSDAANGNGESNPDSEDGDDFADAIEMEIMTPEAIELERLDNLSVDNISIADSDYTQSGFQSDSRRASVATIALEQLPIAVEECLTRRTRKREKWEKVRATKLSRTEKETPDE